MSVNGTIRDAIAGRIAALSTTIGQVYTRERYAAKWDDYLTDFLTTVGSVDQIRAWWVTWAGIPDTSIDGQRFGSAADTFRFVVRGVLGLQDQNATERTFHDLVETVTSQIRNVLTFGVASVMPFSVQAIVPTLELRQFGDVLCHYCEIIVDCTVIQDLNYVAAGVAIAFAFESLTVSSTAIGATASVYSPSGATGAERAFLSCENAPIRYCYDGTTPTATVGHLLAPGELLIIEQPLNIAQFRAIRSGGTDARLQVTYERTG